MSGIETILAVGSLVATAASTGISYMASQQQAAAAEAAGQAQNEAAKFQAAQLKAKAAEEQAAGQRAVMEKRREGEQVMSRQLALAAASGAGTTNPTVLDLIEDTAGQAEYLARGEMYGASSRAAGLRDNAKATLFGGKNALQGSYLEAAGIKTGGLAGVVGGVGKLAGQAGSMYDPKKKTLAYG